MTAPDAATTAEQSARAAAWDLWADAEYDDPPLSYDRETFMARDELDQAIPPAYTEYIGRQLLDHLAAEAAS